MFDQCEVYFGMKEGKLADTAFVPAEAAGAKDSSDD